LMTPLSSAFSCQPSAVSFKTNRRVGFSVFCFPWKPLLNQAFPKGDFDCRLTIPPFDKGGSGGILSFSFYPLAES
jgi:hypothetical protein